MINLNHYTLLILTVFSIIISSCETEPKENSSPKEEQEISLNHAIKKAEVNVQLTRNIQLIAGMDTALNYDHPNWDEAKIKLFARDVNEKFARMQSTRLERISKWNAANLSRTGNTDSAFCFYPFSGGDFVHANWLYPEANEYLLVAMEDVGTVPDLTRAENEEVMEYLDNVDQVLRDIYKRSYFITKNMIKDIKDSNLVNGMFPIILWAAARAEHEVISINYFDIDAFGKSVTIAPKDVTAKSRAVEVVLKHKPSGEEKKVTYISGNISDKGFEAHPGVKKYLANKVPQGCNTFVKSASYLMHYNTFSEIRNFVLDRSAVIVQDDTGIPFEDFDQNVWNVELYGEYEKPVKDFAERLYQEDLDSAYSNDKFYKGGLNFSLGYHWGSGNQNEMFIHRK